MNKIVPTNQQNPNPKQTKLPPLKKREFLQTEQDLLSKKAAQHTKDKDNIRQKKQNLQNSNINLHPEFTEERQNIVKVEQEKKINPTPTPITTKQIISIVVIVLLVLGLIGMVVAIVYTYPIYTTVVIVGTNDLHGKVFPTPLYRSDNNQPYNYGGLSYMITLMNIISNQTQNNLLYVDSGDQYQGGIQSSKYVSSGEIMNDFFKKANLKASALGNHEFDDGPQFLFKFLKGRQTPNIAANLKSQNGASDFLPNQKGEEIYQFTRGIKIGLIGLVTKQTPSTTAAFIKGTFPAYQFLDYAETVLKKSQQLRQKGANAIVLVTHIGNSCVNNFTYGIWNVSNSPNICQNDQISELIDNLPEGTIDAVVQGHRHRIAHYYYKGIPFMGATNGGYYTNFMYLKFDRYKKIIDTSIQGPVPVCQKVFQNLKRCDYVQAADISKAGSLIKWNFHGKEVKEDEQFTRLINNKWGQKMSQYQQFIVNSQISLIAFKDRQYQLGNLFTNILHEIVPDADFTILNTGGFRTQWFPGVINYENFFNMFPFENFIATFPITGSELISTLKVLQSGNQFFPTWNLLSSVQINNQTLERTVLSSKFANGTDIDPNTVYKGVTLLFLINGGDRFQQAKGITYSINSSNIATIGQFRQTVKPFLQQKGTIQKNSLIDPLKPRLIITYK